MNDTIMTHDEMTSSTPDITRRRLANEMASNAMSEAIERVDLLRRRDGDLKDELIDRVHQLCKEHVRDSCGGTLHAGTTDEYVTRNMITMNRAHAIRNDACEELDEIARVE